MQVQKSKVKSQKSFVKSNTLDLSSFQNLSVPRKVLVDRYMNKQVVDHLLKRLECDMDKLTGLDFSDGDSSVLSEGNLSDVSINTTNNDEMDYLLNNKAEDLF